MGRSRESNVRRSTADAQALNQRLVAFRTAASQIVQQPAASRNHLQKASARVMVFGVHRPMLRQIANPPAQDRNLHLWRAGVRFMNPELRNHFCFSFTRQWHSKFDTPRLFLTVLFCYRIPHHNQMWWQVRLCLPWSKIARPKRLFAAECFHWVHRRGLAGWNVTCSHGCRRDERPRCNVCGWVKRRDTEQQRRDPPG
jgi:hypothetical protein